MVPASYNIAPLPPAHQKEIMPHCQIVYIGENEGDSSLLRVACEELGCDVEIARFATNEEALRYFTVRHSGEGIPPPHIIVLAIKPGKYPAHDEVLRYLADHRIFDKVAIHLLSDYKPNVDWSCWPVDKLPLVHRFPGSWDEQLVLTKTI